MNPTLNRQTLGDLLRRTAQRAKLRLVIEVAEECGGKQLL
jgi:hypothetical protein